MAVSDYANKSMCSLKITASLVESESAPGVSKQGAPCAVEFDIVPTQGTEPMKTFHSHCRAMFRSLWCKK